MTTVAPIAPLTSTTHGDHVYPTLTPGQLARISAHGRRRAVEQGEVLQQEGEPATRCECAVSV